MIIQNIELKNWHLFEGEHSLSLRDGNVIIIGKDSHVGKDAFYSALLWCLYKETPDSWKDKGCKCQMGGESSVCIELKHEDHAYRLTRSCNHQKDMKGCVGETFTVQKQAPCDKWVDDNGKRLTEVLNTLRYFTYSETAIYSPDEAKYIQGFIKANNVSDELFLKNLNTIVSSSLERPWAKENITYDKEHVLHIPTATGKGNLFPLLDAGERMIMRLMLRAALVASVKLQTPLIVDNAYGYDSPNHIDSWSNILNNHKNIFSQWILFAEPEIVKNLQ